MRKKAEYADKLSSVPENLELIHYPSDAYLFQALAYLWVKYTDDVFKDEEDVQRACPLEEFSWRCQMINRNHFKSNSEWYRKGRH